MKNIVVYWTDNLGKSRRGYVAAVADINGGAVLVKQDRHDDLGEWVDSDLLTSVNLQSVG